MKNITWNRKRTLQSKRIKEGRSTDIQILSLQFLGRKEWIHDLLNGIFFLLCKSLLNPTKTGESQWNNPWFINKNKLSTN
jgi:hypothetical protein